MDVDDDTEEGGTEEEVEEATTPAPGGEQAAEAGTAAAGGLQVDAALILRALAYHERIYNLAAEGGGPPSPGAPRLRRPSCSMAGLTVFEEAEGEALGALREAHSLAAARLLPDLTAARCAHRGKEGGKACSRVSPVYWQ